MNILLVEDDDGVCTLIKRLMKGLEARVERVPTWTEMELRLDVDRFDVILLDLGLPDSSTHQTLSRIRILKMQHPHTAVCVVTGQPHISESDARMNGADEYIHKNNLTGPRALAQVIAGLVNRFSSSTKKLDTQIGLLNEATRQTIEDMKD